VETETGNVQENRYDVENLRFELLENGRCTGFVYHKGELLHEEGGDKNQTSYHLGTGIDALQRGQALSYYHRDEQLSTAFITGTGGEIQNGYLYDAFGVELEANEQLQNRIRYTGQQYDDLTGQYYLRARYYNPVLGRFLQEDVYQGDGLNLYGYCGNNPVTYYDPSGYAKTPQQLGDGCPPNGNIGEGGNKQSENADNSVALPDYDGKTTQGVLVLDDGRQIPLSSGDGDPRYTNYPNNGHVEQKAALYMKDNDISDATLYHNNTNGTCGFCDSMTSTFLPEGATLTVIPPANAVPNNSRAVTNPKTYVGNNKEPKVSPRYNGQ